MRSIAVVAVVIVLGEVGCARHREQSSAVVMPRPVVKFLPAVSRYTSLRSFIETACPMSEVTPGERLFICSEGYPRYTKIIRFHEGITIPEIVATTPLMSSTKLVSVYKRRLPNTDWSFSPDLIDVSQLEIEPEDVFVLERSEIHIDR